MRTHTDATTAGASSWSFAPTFVLHVSLDEVFLYFESWAAARDVDRATFESVLSAQYLPFVIADHVRREASDASATGEGPLMFRFDPFGSYRDVVTGLPEDWSTFPAKLAFSAANGGYFF